MTALWLPSPSRGLLASLQPLLLHLPAQILGPGNQDCVFLSVLSPLCPACQCFLFPAMTASSLPISSHSSTADVILDMDQLSPTGEQTATNLVAEDSKVVFSPSVSRESALGSPGLLKAVVRCWSSEGSAGERSAFELLWLLFWFSSLWVFGLWTSASCWLLARDCPRLLTP